MSLNKQERDEEESGLGPRERGLSVCVWGVQALGAPVVLAVMGPALGSAEIHTDVGVRVTGSSEAPVSCRADDGLWLKR